MSNVFINNRVFVAFIAGVVIGLVLSFIATFLVGARVEGHRIVVSPGVGVVYAPVSFAKGVNIPTAVRDALEHHGWVVHSEMGTTDVAGKTETIRWVAESKSGKDSLLSVAACQDTAKNTGWIILVQTESGAIREVIVMAIADRISPRT